MFRAFGIGFALAVMLTAFSALTCLADDAAQERVIKFRTPSGGEVQMVRDILANDAAINDFIERDYIRVPEDIRIAKANLDDSARGEILLLIKRASDRPCVEKQCRFQIWKLVKGNWEKIGYYEMKEEELRLYDETYNGYHELANSQGIIPWYEE